MLNFPAKKFWGKTDKEVIDKRALQLNGLHIYQLALIYMNLLQNASKL